MISIFILLIRPDLTRRVTQWKGSLEELCICSGVLECVCHKIFVQ